MAGKPKQSGVKTSVDSQRETAKEIQAKLLHGERDWRMMRLQELVREHHESDERLPDNHLSARAKANAEIARQKRYVLLNEIDALWRDLSAQFERAVLDGDADWFERQAKAIRSRDRRTDIEKARDRFEAAVARQLEWAYFQTRAAKQPHGERPVSFILPVTDEMLEEKRIEAELKESERRKRLAELDRYLMTPKGRADQVRKQRKAAKEFLRSETDPSKGIEAATLEPAGKRTGVTAQQVLDRLSVETVTRPDEIKGARGAILTQSKQRNSVIVEGCHFKSTRRAREAIRRIARLHGYVMAA